jgi:hypothetical protein
MSGEKKYYLVNLPAQMDLPASTIQAARYISERAASHPGLHVGEHMCETQGVDAV